MDEPTIRTARPADFDTVIAVVDDWWGRPVASVLHRYHLGHFADTSLIAEDRDGAVAGFLIGFRSPSQPDLAYVHFAGVAPERRRAGLARELYEWFFATARDSGCTRAMAITSPANSRSIAFHSALGCTVSDPVPDYDGPGVDRVVFRREL